MPRLVSGARQCQSVIFRFKWFCLVQIPPVCALALSFFPNAEVRSVFPLLAFELYSSGLEEEGVAEKGKLAVGGAVEGG